MAHELWKSEVGVTKVSVECAERRRKPCAVTKHWRTSSKAEACSDELWKESPWREGERAQSVKSLERRRESSVSKVLRERERELGQ